MQSRFVVDPNTLLAPQRAQCTLVYSAGWQPVATTTPAGLPVWGPRSAPGSVFVDPCCQSFCFGVQPSFHATSVRPAPSFTEVNRALGRHVRRTRVLYSCSDAKRIRACTSPGNSPESSALPPEFRGFSRDKSRADGRQICGKDC
jgi:hypothetical protein